jgi:hypothetical protein
VARGQILKGVAFSEARDDNPDIAKHPENLIE